MTYDLIIKGAEVATAADVTRADIGIRDGKVATLGLDLGEATEITHFGFRSRKMTDGTSIIERVRVVFDGVEHGPFDTPDPDQHYLFELDAPVDARLVRIEAVQTTGGNTGAKEIQLLRAP